MLPRSEHTSNTASPRTLRREVLHEQGNSIHIGEILGKNMKHVIAGQAVIADGELRCGGYVRRFNNTRWVCRRLLAKSNKSGQIAGEFKCKCGQIVAVRLTSAGYQ